MKINRISIMLLAGAAFMLSSCFNEEEMEYGAPASMSGTEVAFKLGVATRSATESEAEVNHIASVRVEDFATLTLQEEVTILDEALATRGTPAFTENVDTLYGSFSAVANPNATDEKKLADTVFPFYAATDLWSYDYKDASLWQKAPFKYYLRMPADIANGSYGLTSDLTYGSDTDSNSTISFSYTSPGSYSSEADTLAGKKQTDILFTTATIEDIGDNPKKVTFYHALTGVKFANFFDYGLNEGAYAKAETIIKEVTISGLKNSGTCVITPSKGVSGKSAAAAAWTLGTTTATFTQSIAHDFADYSKSKYDLSPLDTTAAKNNINDDDASLTFWFIPQELTEDVTITVVFDVSLKTLEGTTVTSTEKTFSDVTLTANLYDALADGHRTWRAGELHTFTLWPTAVGVKISDTMSDDGTTKSQTVVKNTGNTWQYVRVNIVGNWVGNVQKSASATDLSAETILMGYASSDTSDDTETEPWNDKDGYTSYGTFVNLVAKSSTSSPVVTNNWVRFDKYYYYTKAIGPNDAITDPIFDSYTVGASPEFWIVDLWGIRRKAQNVHLVMDLMAEAIEAPTDAEGNLIYPDGTPIGENTDGYMKAWAAALGLSSVSGLDDLK